MASNPFAFFGLEPAPEVDVAALKERFARDTAETHPDRFAQAAESERLAAEAHYTALNQAYQTLIDPRARLLALYELTKGAKPADIQRIPPGTMDLFKEVGEICQTLDIFIEKKKTATNRLEKAALMSEELTLQDSLTAVRMKLEAFAATVEAEVKALDVKWRAGEKDLDALEAVYRKYSYVARWRQQLEEREIELMTED